MELVREERMNQDTYVWTASSLGGNPISCTAAKTALDLYSQEGTYTHLHKLGKFLREGMRNVLSKQNEEAQVIGDGPLAQVVFSREPVTDYRSTKRGDRYKGRHLMLKLFEKGIFLNPMGTKLYLSMKHNQSVCDEFLNRFQEALVEVKQHTVSK